MNAHAEGMRGIAGAMNLLNRMPNAQMRLAEAADEIERLEYENAKLREQIAELNKDKERIEWIKGNIYSCHTPNVELNQGFNAWEFYAPYEYGWNDVLELIDKAMEQAK